NGRTGAQAACAALFGACFGPSAPMPSLDDFAQRPVRRFAEGPQLLDAALLQDLRLRLVGCFVRKLALGNKQGLANGPALILMRALLALRDVFPAALLVLAIGVAPVVLVAQALLLLRRFD